MSLVESKRFMPKKMAAVAVIQFLIYMSFFYGYYYLQHFTYSSSTWRFIFVGAVLIGLWNSITPALARDISDNIRLGTVNNLSYYALIISIAAFVLYMIANIYYRWTFHLPENVLSSGLMIYLITHPCLSFLFIIAYKEINYL